VSAEQLILVRHGETKHNVAGIAQGWGDSELSARGRQQVSRLAERLKWFQPDAIFSSTLDRARATAAAIAKATGLEVQYLDDLREMNYGNWEGKSFLDVRKTDRENYLRWMDDENFACPEGESHDHVLQRMRRAFAVVQNAVKRPVFVSHGTAIRIGVTALLDLPLAASRRFAQDNTAINLFLWRSERWVLKVWNDTQHCNDER
jgi:broad specificity phosphatase PhoE